MARPADAAAAEKNRPDTSPGARPRLPPLTSRHTASAAISSHTTVAAVVARPTQATPMRCRVRRRSLCPGGAIHPATLTSVKGSRRGQTAKLREPDVSGLQWYTCTVRSPAGQRTTLRVLGSLRHETTDVFAGPPSTPSGVGPPIP